MTQKQAILRHLQTRGDITPLEALREYGCFRLAARIWELREAGVSIVADEVELPSKTKVARYRLAEPTQIGAGL